MNGAVTENLSQFLRPAILASDSTSQICCSVRPTKASAGCRHCYAVVEQGATCPIATTAKRPKPTAKRTTVGAEMQGRVLIIDDVISAGTSVRESIELIRSGWCRNPAGVVIALDRMERGQGELSAVQEVQQNYNIPVVPIVTLTRPARLFAG